MTSVAEEIQKLQLRIQELETQQKEKEELEKKTAVEHNLNVINDILIKKKERRWYPKSELKSGGSKMRDEELVIRLEAIYNILQNFDGRLKKIEVKYNL